LVFVNQKPVFVNQQLNKERAQNDYDFAQRNTIIMRLIATDRMISIKNIQKYRDAVTRDRATFPPVNKILKTKN
jgi:hypothetical protein